MYEEKHEEKQSYTIERGCIGALKSSYYQSELQEQVKEASEAAIQGDLGMVMAKYNAFSRL